MSAKVSVIIPYYQEKAGILRRAVLSAIAQERVSNLEIIVVDDGSPASARDDLKDLDLPARVTLKLIEQPNRGPGAARNCALSSVGSNPDYIAFLDSDDIWAPWHLSVAVDILDAGYDLYFSDADIFGSRLFCRQRFNVGEHICLDRERGLYKVSGNLCLVLIDSSVPVHTSTVVYRYGKFSYLRFPENFFMGEDVTVWIAIARRSDRIVFSSDVGCVFGDGVHIARESRWGTAKLIWQLYNFMIWRKWFSRQPILGPQERAANLKNIRETRRRFVVALLHELRRLRAFQNPYITRFLISDPLTILYILPVAAHVVIKKILRNSYNKIID